MPELDAIRSRTRLIKRIHRDALKAMAQRRHAEAEEMLEMLNEALSGTPLLHVLTAHATSLELRTHRLRAWIEEEKSHGSRRVQEL